ncbi:hypothetical protein AAFF_G00195800 [Aldrovandia affinis]|uniref:C2H2-type domain-containing protein n=1 Tax=Aldrovandia affinis TaxID=143900 RepID=A0AAD7W6B4_9TELE|nr:hypothetical protein AAFF_G00195800 [Aldrovandia affinis]
MSRRKLGSRPQHLSAIQDAPEPSDITNSLPKERAPAPEAGGRDLLTCGPCGQAFPLAHILAFIQHKQGGCGLGMAAPQGHTPPSPANRTLRRSSPAAPCAWPGAGYVELRRMTDRGWGEEPGAKSEPRQAGAEEPTCFTCQVCEGVFPTAWALLQHAQHIHALSLYQEEGAEEQPSAPTSTLDPSRLGHALASAFHPAPFCPPRLRDGPQFTGPAPSRDSRTFNFSVRLRELADVSGGGVVPSPSPSPPAAAPFPQAPPPQALLACELCGQGFQSLRSLSAHRRTHAGERPYRCGLCDRTFAQSGELARHMRMHRRGGAWAGRAEEGAEEGGELILNARLSQETAVEGSVSEQGERETPELDLSKHAPGGLILLGPGGGLGGRGLLGLFQPQAGVGGGEGDAPAEPQQPSPCGSPSEGSLDSGETGASGESGIASGDCTPKRQEREGERDGEREWEAMPGEALQEWQRESEPKRGRRRRRRRIGEEEEGGGLRVLRESSKLTRHMKTHGARGSRPAFLCQLCHVPFTVYATLEKHLKKAHGLSHADVGAFSRADPGTDEPCSAAESERRADEPAEAFAEPDGRASPGAGKETAPPPVARFPRRSPA